MAQPRLPVSDLDIGQFWHEFPNSRPQRVLRHELEIMIESERDLLERAQPFQDVRRHQANLLALRRLVAVLHRKD